MLKAKKKGKLMKKNMYLDDLQHSKRVENLCEFLRVLYWYRVGRERKQTWTTKILLNGSYKKAVTRKRRNKDCGLLDCDEDGGSMFL
jgi:hypothetical protein